MTNCFYCDPIETGSIVCLDDVFSLTTNAGVNNVVTTFTLPAGTAVSGSPTVSSGIWDGGALTWTLATVNTGTTYTLSDLCVEVADVVAFSALAKADRKVVAVSVLVGETDTSNNTKEVLISGTTCADLSTCISDTNFAEDDLTFDAARLHDGDGNSFDLTNFASFDWRTSNEYGFNSDGSIIEFGNLDAVGDAKSVFHVDDLGNLILNSQVGYYFGLDKDGSNVPSVDNSTTLIVTTDAADGSIHVRDIAAITSGNNGMFSAANEAGTFDVQNVATDGVLNIDVDSGGLRLWADLNFANPYMLYLENEGLLGAFMKLEGHQSTSYLEIDGNTDAAGLSWGGLIRFDSHLTRYWQIGKSITSQNGNFTIGAAHNGGAVSDLTFETIGLHTNGVVDYSTGQWRYPQYTAPASFPITETALLGVNATGHIGTLDTADYDKHLANANLTFTGDRTHDGDGNSLTLENLVSVTIDVDSDTYTPRLDMQSSAIVGSTTLIASASGDAPGMTAYAGLLHQATFGYTNTINANAFKVDSNGTYFLLDRGARYFGPGDGSQLPTYDNTTTRIVSFDISTGEILHTTVADIVGGFADTHLFSADKSMTANRAHLGAGFDFGITGLGALNFEGTTISWDFSGGYFMIAAPSADASPTHILTRNAGTGEVSLSTIAQASINWANTDLTLTGNRTHDLDTNGLDYENVDYVGFDGADGAAEIALDSAARISIEGNSAQDAEISSVADSGDAILSAESDSGDAYVRLVRDGREWTLGQIGSGTLVLQPVTTDGVFLIESVAADLGFQFSTVDGSMVWEDYTAPGDHPGTETALIAVDTNGNVITVDPTGYGATNENLFATNSLTLAGDHTHDADNNNFIVQNIDIWSLVGPGADLEFTLDRTNSDITLLIGDGVTDESSIVIAPDLYTRVSTDGTDTMTTTVAGNLYNTEYDSNSYFRLDKDNTIFRARVGGAATEYGQVNLVGGSSGLASMVYSPALNQLHTIGYLGGGSANNYGVRSYDTGGGVDAGIFVNDFESVNLFSDTSLFYFTDPGGSVSLPTVDNTKAHILAVDSVDGRWYLQELSALTFDVAEAGSANPFSVAPGGEIIVQSTDGSIDVDTSSGNVTLSAEAAISAAVGAQEVYYQLHITDPNGSPKPDGVAAILPSHDGYELVGGVCAVEESGTGDTTTVTIHRVRSGTDVDMGEFDISGAYLDASPSITANDDVATGDYIYVSYTSGGGTPPSSSSVAVTLIFEPAAV